MEHKSELSHLMEIGKKIHHARIDDNVTLIADLQKSFEDMARKLNISLNSTEAQLALNGGKFLAGVEDFASGKSIIRDMRNHANSELPEAKGWSDKIKTAFQTPTRKGVAIASGILVVAGGAMIARHFAQKHEPEQQSDKIR